MMKFIRESFAEGYEPFSFCRGCASRLTNYDRTDAEYDFIDLHIPIIFDATVGANASRRTSAEIEAVSGGLSDATSTRIRPKARNSILANRRQDRPCGERLTRLRRRENRTKPADQTSK